MRPVLLEFTKSKKSCLSKIWESRLLRKSGRNSVTDNFFRKTEFRGCYFFSSFGAFQSRSDFDWPFRKLFFPSPRFRRIWPGTSHLSGCVTCNFRRGAKRSTRKKDHCPAPSGVVTLSHVRRKNKKRGRRNPAFGNFV